MGLRSVILGHAYERVATAAHVEIDRGANHTRRTWLEEGLAGMLHARIPCAERVAFGKNGSDATTAAVRVARAFTERERIVVVGDSFHASDDWWLSIGPRPAGTFDQGTRRVPYNDVPHLEDALRSKEVAAVVMEPMAFEWPHGEYLEAVRYVTKKYGTLLVFDEVITGFRFGMGGAQEFFGVTPDLACFGKAMANGFSVSALAGRRDIMETPGVHLLSSTHGGETHALAAAIATIDELEAKKVPERIQVIGDRLRLGLFAAGYDVRGHPASPTVVFADEPARMRFMAGMCDRGILAPYWAPSFSHTEADVDRTIAAAREVAA